MVRIGTLNIQSRWHANLDCALRGLQILGVDIVIILETKIDDEVHKVLTWVRATSN
jgi:hypothetical protein